MRWLIFLIIIFSGCKGNYEESTTVDAYLKNSSTHSIEIRPYWGGIVQQQYVIELQPNVQKQIAHFFMLGKSLLGGGFHSDYLSNADSIVVIFDNLYSISHYAQHFQYYAPKHYLRTSTRNLANIDSYQGVTTDETRYSIHHDYYYVFTEQDYQDAQ